MAFSETIRLVLDAVAKGDGVKKITADLNQAEGATGKLKAGFGGLGRELSSGFGVAAISAGIGAGIKVAVDAASSLHEQVSKTRAVFGDSASAIEKWAEGAAKAFGQSETQALTAVSTFGNLFKAMGLGAGPTRQMSQSLVELASDLSSFNDVPVDEVFEALRSGLTGEIEPLRRFGVNLNEATLKAEAMRLGLSDGKSTLDAAAKAQAAYSLIMQQTTTAQGDFARTADGLANSQRTASAEFENAKAALGEGLIPAVTEATQAFSDLIELMKSVPGGIQVFAEGGIKGWQRWGEAIIGTGKDLGQFFGLFKEHKKPAESLDVLTTKVDALGRAVGPAGAAIGDFARNTEDHFVTAAGGADVLTQSVSQLGREIGPAGTGFGDLSREAASVVTSLDMVPTSADAAANHIARTGSEMGDTEAAAQRLAEAIDTVHTALDSVINARLDTAKLTQDVVEAAEKANEVAKDSKATALDQAVAYDDVAKKALELAENHRQVAKDAGAADGGNKAFIDTLKFISATAAPEVKARVDDMIAAYESFGKQHPKATLDANSEPAKTEVKSASQLLFEFSGMHSLAEIGVNDYATGQIREAIRLGQLFAGSTYTADVNTRRTGVHAIGGAAQGLTWVGENGPELVNLPPGSWVHPNGASERTGAQFSSSVSAPTNVVINLPVGTDPTAVQAAVDRYRLRNGSR